MQVNQEKRNQFKTNYELVKTGITKGYEENISLESIAKSLNQLGLKTVGGLDWTSSSVCIFAIKELGLRRTKEHKSFTKKTKTNKQTTEQVNDNFEPLNSKQNDEPKEQEQKEKIKGLRLYSSHITPIYMCNHHTINKKLFSITFKTLFSFIILGIVFPSFTKTTPKTKNPIIT